MKTKKHMLVALSAFLLVSTPLLPFTPASEVQAVADTFTLTKVGNDKISIVLNGTPQVQLPNGAIVTTNTTFTVKENKTYTFVGIDGAVKVQKAITMTTVPNTVPLLMVSPGEKVFLNFESGDAHSGVKDMRYVGYNEASGQGSIPFTAWEAFTSKKPWVVPTIPIATSANWVVKAEFRDNAGNVVSGVIGRFFIDNVAPVNNLGKTVSYTNNRNINVIANIVTKYQNPETGYVGLSPTGTFQSYDLSNFSNLYTGANVGDERNFEYALPYILPITEGVHNVFFKSTKRQNNLLLTSETLSKPVVYDKTAPTGSVVINDGEKLLPTQEVKLTIKTADTLSGIDKIKIVEETSSGNVKEKVINNPSPTEVYDWTLTMKDSTHVEVVIYDKAGNTKTVVSQDVSFAKLSIINFELTNNRNPAVYHSGNPFQVKTWDWRGEDETMLAGSNFDFNIYYDLGLGQPVNYTVTGSYTIRVESADGSYNYTDTVVYDTNNPVVNGFAGTRIEIPVEAPPGAKVMISSDMKAVKKNNTALISEANFPPAYIGTVGKTLNEEVNGLINFNELN
jgi:hypothetical protein